jgi:heavy metal sensor kinase
MIFSSIRIKLTLWYIGVLALILFAFAGAAYSVFIQALENETDENLVEIARSLVGSITSEVARGEHAVPDERMVEVLNDYRFRDYECAFFTERNELISTTRQLEPSSALTLLEESYGKATFGDEPFRVLFMPFFVKGQNYKLYVFTSLHGQLALQGRLGRLFLLLTPLFVFFAGVGGHFLARQSLKPIADIGEQAKQISAANLNKRLTVSNENDEIGKLAVLFNELLDRLDTEFDRQRRFMADASHELRTPIAIVRGESEVTLAKESRSEAEYREALSVVNDESTRLSKIVEDLFTLARADSGELKADRREFYVDELVAECVRAIRTLAKKRNITVEFSNSEMQVCGDEALLRRLFLNLLDNAVKYNIDGGTIRVSVSGNSVSVSNTGPGIPPEQQELIFERFYRAEKSRSRRAETTTSGAGLGLSISRKIADLHDAELKYSRMLPGENTFTIIFPR